MARLEYFIVCRSASVDVDTDEITLSNVIEDLYLEAAGATVLPRIVAVSSWNVSQEDASQDFQTELRITLPGQSEPVDFAMNLAKGRHRYRAIIGVVGIPLGQTGDLMFEILLNGRHGASHRVMVHPPGTRFEDSGLHAVLPPTGTRGQPPPRTT